MSPERVGSARVLVAAWEVPSWGGAATSAHALFESLRDRGVAARFLALVPPRQAEFLEGGAVADESGATYLLLPEDDRRWGGRVAAATAAERPDLFVAVGWPAARILGRAAPDVPLLLLTSGLSRLKSLIAGGEAADLVSAMRRAEDLPWDAAPDRGEHEAVRLADRVICHSEPILHMFGHCYPEAASRLHPRIVSFAAWICRQAARHAAPAKAFDSRPIDLLFVANDWTRPEKNYALAHRIAAALPERTVHVIGRVPSPVPGARHHGFVEDRAALMRLMGDARVVACPSVFDAAPGILFEAAVAGANIVASRNCGNWSVCHEELVADPPSTEAFVAAVRKGLARPYENGLAGYLERDSLDELIRALDETGVVADRSRAEGTIS